MKILKGILFVMFILAGALALIGTKTVATAFVSWGYPLWFMHLIGALEIIFAALLLVRRTWLFASLGLIVIMAGALYTHISHDEPLKNMIPALVATICLLSLLAIRSRRASAVTHY
ncbi:DoxX family protein [Candidatus Parcubacteria bacterium]|nr:DoxX family protein [Candidatus Parcubacteria bacterium]